MADAMAPAEDNSAIEGALKQIETAVADIRAQLSQGKQEPPTAPAGDMAGAGNPAAGGGGLEQFLGGK